MNAMLSRADLQEWTLGTPNGIAVSFLNYGASITSLRVPDDGGGVTDVIVGYTTAADYVGGLSPRSAVMGRFANRIAHGRFLLDGIVHTLDLNDPPVTIHGGRNALDRTFWAGERSGNTVIFRHVSPPNFNGFPGALQVEVCYTVSADALTIHYTAATDAPTVVNLTNHAYFNLAGGGDILDHELKIAGDSFLEIDANSIPNGRKVPVDGSIFDFRQSRRLRQALESGDPRIVSVGGIDHNFIVGDGMRKAPVPVARLNTNRITMDVLTTEPGVQVYTGNRMRAVHSAICLETQHFPDSPNQPDFPSTVLRPGSRFKSTTIYAFSRSAQ
jgi:aldose 1-epimerase